MFIESPQYLYEQLHLEFHNRTDFISRSAQLAARDRILVNDGSNEWRESLKALFPKPDLEESYQFSTLHKAVLGLSHRSIENVLDEDRAQIDEVDCFGRTALSWAVFRHDSQAVGTILSYEPDCSRADNAGDTPLSYASRISTSCLELLLKMTTRADLEWRHKISKGTLLHGAIINYTVENTRLGFERVKMLVDAGVNVNARSNTGWTALFHGIYPQKDFAELLSYLIRQGADPSICSKQGHNALSYAVQRNCHALIEILLHEHVDHTGRVEEHRTFMHLVAEFADTRSLELLAQGDLQRRNTNVKNIVGLTPTQVALKRQDTDDKWKIAFFTFLKNIDQEIAPVSSVSETSRLALDGSERLQEVKADWAESDDENDAEAEFVDALESQV